MTDIRFWSDFLFTISFLFYFTFLYYLQYCIFEREWNRYTRITQEWYKNYRQLWVIRSLHAYWKWIHSLLINRIYIFTFKLISSVFVSLYLLWENEYDFKVAAHSPLYWTYFLKSSLTSLRIILFFILFLCIWLYLKRIPYISNGLVSMYKL